MFTGIIQETGKIKNKIQKGSSIRFSVQPSSRKFLKDVKKGDSISINGACMTIETKDKDKFEFTVINESLSKTNLGMLGKKNIVNLEKAMTMKSKLDGHIVQGHIDTTGTIENIIPMNGSYEFYVKLSSEFRENIIYVGSISLNGVSLTIAGINDDNKDEIIIKTAIIPHTFKATNFHLLKKGDTVNIEFDMMGKYVRSIISLKK